MSAISSAFLDSIICFLMPHFGGATADASAMWSEVLETLASYGARSRAEMINAAQVIALGLATLDTLAESKAPDMSPAARLRFRGCANNLNRSGQRTEITLAKRLASDAPSPAAPVWEPVNDLPDAAAALQQTKTSIEASRRPAPTHLTPAPPAPAYPAPKSAAPVSPAPAPPAPAPPAALSRAISQALTATGPHAVPVALRASAPPASSGPRPDPYCREERNKRLWASAMTQVLSELGASPATTASASAQARNQPSHPHTQRPAA